MTSNAVMRVVQPTEGRRSGELLQKSHGEEAGREIGCSFRGMSAQAAATSMGRVTATAYVCRCRERVEVRPGWFIEVRKRTEADWTRYRVETVSGETHTVLMVEAT